MGAHLLIRIVFYLPVLVAFFCRVERVGRIGQPLR